MLLLRGGQAPQTPLTRVSRAIGDLVHVARCTPTVLLIVRRFGTCTSLYMCQIYESGELSVGLVGHVVIYDSFGETKIVEISPCQRSGKVGEVISYDI